MDQTPYSNQPSGAGSSSEKPGVPAAGAPPPAYVHSQPVPMRLYPGQPGIIAQPACNVPDYLAYSIFITVCCCLPLGVAALIYSCSTRDANLLGQRELAEKNSKMTRTLNHIGLGIGITIFVVVIISQIVFWTRVKTWI